MKKMQLVLWTALFAVTLAVPLGAQEPEATPPPGKAAGAKMASRIPLRVTVTLSRHLGEKRISSMPYVLGVAAAGSGAGPRTTMRMGIDVPVLQTVFGAAEPGAAGKPQASYTYRNVGTNIDCSATVEESAPGIFQLALTVADTSLSLDAAKRPDSGVANAPAFRSFNSSFTALLRDGQTMQYTSATDPMTGEVMRIEVQVAVMK